MAAHVRRLVVSRSGVGRDGVRLRRLVSRAWERCVRDAQMCARLLDTGCIRDPSASDLTHSDAAVVGVALRTAA
jgi:hypothetical protein